MLIITGHTHSTFDGWRLKPEHFDYSGLTKEDHLLICGDFGFVWTGDERDKKELDWLEELPVTVVFIDGNHENFDLLESYPVSEYHGGKVHQIRSNIYHLMRGQFYELNGYTVFTFGGAFSIDRMLRTPGVSWWAHELPTPEDYAEARKNLEAHDWRCDLIVTHSAPFSLHHVMFPVFPGDDLSRFLEELKEKMDYDHWYFGHFHEEKEFGAKISLLYTNYVYLEDKK